MISSAKLALILLIGLMIDITNLLHTSDICDGILINVHDKCSINSAAMNFYQLQQNLMRSV